MAICRAGSARVSLHRRATYGGPQPQSLGRNSHRVRPLAGPMITPRIPPRGWETVRRAKLVAVSTWSLAGLSGHLDNRRAGAFHLKFLFLLRLFVGVSQV